MFNQYEIKLSEIVDGYRIEFLFMVLTRCLYISGQLEFYLFQFTVFFCFHEIGHITILSYLLQTIEGKSYPLRKP